MKYLVYTCVTNNYDKVRKVIAKQDPNIDFVCFTDKIGVTMDLRADTGWIFMPIPNDLKGIDCKRQARMIKIGINKYLKGYAGYLWIDAPIIIIGNIGEFIKEHPFDDNHGIYVSKHYMRDCVYQEFAQVLRLNKDRSACVYNQYERYRDMGYPKHNGMAETSILYRNLADLKVQTHAVTWAEQVMNWSYRDQLSFNWAAWATKTKITYLNEDIYKRDVENETSKYFFLPWPKHNNNLVVQQLQKRLQKNPVNKLIVKIVHPEQKSQISQAEQFELEYTKFIEELKRKKEEVKLEDKATQKVEDEISAQPMVTQPKKKRGRRKKVK